MAKDLKQKWADANRQILDGLNIEQEYRALGVRIPSGAHARATGWMTVHAVGRDDSTPSAEINVGDGPAKGRYRDFGGDGRSVGLFDFAAQYGPFGGDWRAARNHFARQANVKLPDGAEEVAADKFDFFELTPGVMLNWCSKKTIIKPQAVKAAGGVGARWPKGLRPELTQHLIAFPAFGSGLLDLEPCGWHCVNSTGASIKKFKGQGNEPDLLKTMQVSTPGLMNVYALSRLAEAKVVWIVEGISDMLAMQTVIPEESGHLVLTTGACTYHPQAAWMQHFAGKDVRVCFDCDRAGQTGAAVWIASLVPVTASVRNVVLPYEITPDHGKDIRDYLADHSYLELWQLSEACAPVDAEDEIAQTEPHQVLLDKLGIIVSGQIEGTEHIEIFSTLLNKKTTIKDIDRFSYAKAVMALGGDAVEQYITDGAEPVPGKAQIRDVRNAIAREGAKRFLNAESAVGVGVWPVKDALVLVNSRSVDVWNGSGSLESISTPAVYGQRIDFGAVDWYERDQLARYVELAKDANWAHSQMEKATELFTRWDNWKNGTAPHLLTGLVCATWIQTAWELRPQVAVIGPTNCGKTILLKDTLAQLFGPLALWCEKPTEAGIRQAIDNTGKVLMIDEFEEDYHRHRVLELLRTSSRGGRIIRGTVSQKGASYGLRHIAWMSGIELGLKGEADRNRFIVLELKKLPAGRPSQLRLPAKESLRDLGLSLLAITMQHWQAAVAMAANLKTRPMDGVDNRIVELYAAPVAIFSLAMGWQDYEAESFLRACLGERKGRDAEESDEERLLQDIYESVLILPRGGRVTVSQLLQGQMVEDANREPVDRMKTLASVGITVLYEPDRVFFAKNPVCKELLRASNFKSLDIDQILLRVDGAKRERPRFAGHRPNGVSIPLQSINALINPGANDDTESPNVKAQYQFGDTVDVF